MKKLIFILSSCVLFLSCSVAQVNKQTDFFRYELECVGTGNDGTYLLKVWSYAKKPKVALNEGKRNAIHGVIFKGFTAAYNCQPQKPIATDPGIETQFQDYFSKFFADGGAYLKYVSVSSDGTPEMMKVGKEYKVGYTVSVSKDLLRSDLEQAGIIKGLSSGF